jgi:hypothetical protein
MQKNVIHNMSPSCFIRTNELKIRKNKHLLIYPLNFFDIRDKCTININVNSNIY